LKPLVIVALHLPELRRGKKSIPMSWLEDYVLQNTALFYECGVPAVILQEETLNNSDAYPESVAVLSVLGSKVHQQFPDLQLGIIMQAHDGVSPIAVAHACGASFVRLKVFIGAMLKSEGIQQGLGIAARDYRSMIDREDIKILADVHDRTGFPMADIPIEMASEWAVRTGADSLILTGFTHEESLQYLSSVRKSGITVPLILGGGATEENVSEVLKYADGVIVSSALKHQNPKPEDIILWDRDLVRRFMDAA
jgi:predicted TIM-barrel enzyme